MYEQKNSKLPFIQCICQAKVFEEGQYDDPAKETWGLAFTKRIDGSFAAELLGPSFNYKILGSNVGDQYWGVEFYSFVTMRGVDKPNILGKLVPLKVIDTQFIIDKDSYTIPDFNDIEIFCERLASQGIISHTNQILSPRKDLSRRSHQRHHLQTIGLTHKQVEQIKRAEYAASLLKTGLAPVEVASETGYADQSHMTRSLKALLGKTPAIIRQQD